MQISNTRIVVAALLATFIVGSASAAQAQRLDSDPESPTPAADAAARVHRGGAGRLAAASSSTATIHGSVFYNDRRTDGLFDVRRD